jgi:isoleucyl-tRNA synthetase
MTSGLPKKYGIGALTLVDRKGKFIDEAGWLAGKYVKNEYDESYSRGAETTDVEIAVHLKNENRAFRIEKYVHSYPHCWRTDKPVLILSARLLVHTYHCIQGQAY